MRELKNREKNITAQLPLKIIVSVYFATRNKNCINLEELLFYRHVNVLYRTIVLLTM